MRSRLGALLLILPTLAFCQTPDELKKLYLDADRLAVAAQNRVFKLTIEPGWSPDGKTLIYKNRLKDGLIEWVGVDCPKGKKFTPFDAQKVGDALKMAANKIDLDRAWLSNDRKELRFFQNRSLMMINLTTYAIAAVPRDAPRPMPPQDARVTDGQLEVKDGEAWTKVDQPHGFTRMWRSPDQKYFILSQVIPGDRREVFRIDTTQPGTRGVLKRNLYDQVGDKLDSCLYWIYDRGAKTLKQVPMDPVSCGGYPWAEAPDIEWWTGKAVYMHTFRGFQRQQVVEIDPATATQRVLVDEQSKTFVDTTQTGMRLLPSGKSLLWMSERDMWCHIYLVDRATTQATQITKGPWVVRELQDADETKGLIRFAASGKEPGDPYLKRVYTVDFSGNIKSTVTPEVGDHSVQVSPGGEYCVDTYSQLNTPPVHELRRVKDGKLMTLLDTADTSEFDALGNRRPEIFVAKGRDGVTDIWGYICRPNTLEPGKKYPVVEDIYAGPHDSFVPHSYRASLYQQRMAQIGFVVVQMDGMGTRNRGKRFHDVCWQNIADAGFEDRIAWMKAAAAKYPEMDITRVGIYGTSAGGQNAAGAVLFHPEFYKAAVASCGCHDNRIDKWWWNEQWMGPMGPHYEAQSNITNAAKLKGALLLMVGEVDSNVPPESTYKLADALQKARREFDLVVLPGQDHTAGGIYGERKRRDFFVRHLLGLQPPRWNE